MSHAMIQPIKGPEPAKWRKHLVLVDWGLRDKEHLLNSIKRYPFGDYVRCLQDIQEDIVKETAQYAYILKLVNLKRLYKLPNIIISSEENVRSAYEELKQYDLSNFTEIWYCRNLVENQGTVFGRIMFNNENLFPGRCSQRIEMVWGASARDIDKYPQQKCPFIAFQKQNWNTEPKLIKILPNGAEEHTLLAVSEQIIDRVSQYTRRMKEFGEFVFSCGGSHLCLEFSYCQNQMRFIDWDSDCDEAVLGGCG